MTSAPAAAAALPAPEPRSYRLPRLPLLLVAVFLALCLVPRIGESGALLKTFGAVAALLLGWSGLLWLRDGGRAGAFGVLVPPLLRTHVVQACVQVSIYTYWGWYWPEVQRQVPLFIAQIIFLCTFDALLAWSRGRSWRFGMGPLPIVLSTNIFLWFRDDWFLYQFLLLAVAALGKEFITWERLGRRRHVFNPSAFALGIFSLVLIVTDTTYVTWAVDIATTIFRPPYIYLHIFLLGLVVQFLFGTVLMTLAAAAVLYLFNVVYTAQTGVYFFLDTNISAAVFLGFHLLVTDPSTSPRGNLGKVIFGGLYGASICALYAVLGDVDAPQLYDKLLPIPLLNLTVRFLDHVTTSGALGRLSRWEAALPARRTNLAYMGCWTALFVTMYTTGFVEAPHPGRKLAFWREAQLEGKHDAADKLLQLVSTRAAKQQPTALNALGSLIMEGQLLPRDVQAAAGYFAQACEGGSDRGCVNVARVFLLFGAARSTADVDRALTHIEQRLAGESAAPDAHVREDEDEDEAESEDEDDERISLGESAYLLGLAYESERGRPLDVRRAAACYLRGAALGNLDACRGVARCIRSVDDAVAARAALDALSTACAEGDADACVLLGFAIDTRRDLARGDEDVNALLQRACALGHEAACAALVNRR